MSESDYEYLDRELEDLLREAKEWSEKNALVERKCEEERSSAHLFISEVDTLKKQICMLSIVVEKMYRLPTEKKEGEVVDKKILERIPKIESIIKGIQSIVEECQFEIQVTEEEEYEQIKNVVKDETDEGFEEAEMPSIVIGVASIFIAGCDDEATYRAGTVEPSVEGSYPTFMRRRLLPLIPPHVQEVLYSVPPPMDEEKPRPRTKARRSRSTGGSTSAAAGDDVEWQAPAGDFFPGVPTTAWEARIRLRQDDGSYTTIPFDVDPAFQVYYEPPIATHVPVSYYSELMRVTDSIKSVFLADHISQQDRIDALWANEERISAERDRVAVERDCLVVERNHLRTQMAMGSTRGGAGSSHGGRARRALTLVDWQHRVAGRGRGRGGGDNDDYDDMEDPFQESSEGFDD